MIATKTSQIRRQRRALAVALVLLLGVDGVTLFLRHGKARPVTVNDAVKQFRADTAQTPTPTPTHTSALPSDPASSTPSPSDTVTPIQVVTATANPVPSPSSHHSTHPVTTSSPGPTASDSAAPAPTPTPTPSSGGTALSLPSPGVYAYDTAGSEKIGVPGGSRDFPATSTITVESSGCGVLEKWVPNSQHEETKQLCLHNGVVRLAGFSTTVKFFGIGSTETYSCGKNATVYSPKVALGRSTTFSCTSSNSTAKQTVTPVGYTHLTVGGTTVRTLKVTVGSVLSGKNQGTSSQTLWLTTDHSVLVRNTGTIDAKQQGVDYHEHYTLNLQDLTPAQ